MEQRRCSRSVARAGETDKRGRFQAQELKPRNQASAKCLVGLTGKKSVTHHHSLESQEKQ
jgi:hypothetical protein